MINNLPLIDTEINKCIIKEYKKNEIIFPENALCEYVGILIKGVVSISSFSFNGNELTLNVLMENDIFGNNLIFSSDPIYKGNVISKTNTKILLISKNNLISLLQNNKSFLSFYLRKQSDFSKTLNAKLKMFTFNKVSERLMYLFYINHNKIKFHSINELSKEIATSRENLSRLINKLVKENLIIKKNNELILIDNKWSEI